MVVDSVPININIVTSGHPPPPIPPDAFAIAPVHAAQPTQSIQPAPAAQSVCQSWDQSGGQWGGQCLGHPSWRDGADTGVDGESGFDNLYGALRGDGSSVPTTPLGGSYGMDC